MKYAALINTKMSMSLDVCKEYLKHEERLSASGLDLHSCLQFLLDLYSQWTQPEVIHLLFFFMKTFIKIWCKKIIVFNNVSNKR